MGAWVIAIMCGALLVLEGAALSAFGVSEWPLGLALAVVVFLGVRKEFSSSAYALAALLPLMEWMAVGRSGVLAFSYLVVFLLLRLARSALDARRGQAMLAAGAGVLGALTSHSAQWVMLKMMGDETPLSHAVIVTAPQAALTAAPVCAVLVWSLGRLERAFDPRRNASDLLD